MQTLTHGFRTSSFITPSRGRRNMTVMGAFTPADASLGGLLLGVSTAAQLLLTGRVLGVSGTVKGTMLGSPGTWRPATLLGMAAAALPLAMFVPSSFVVLPPSYSYLRAICGGLLVGVGTGMGNGCTSGHGICGLARLSVRSLVYTLTFMAAGAVTATLTQSAAAVGIVTDAALPLQLASAATVTQALGIMAVATAAFAAIGVAASKNPSLKQKLETPASGLIGATFAAGLALSGMTLPSKVIAFLSPTIKAWDPSLAFVMGSALAVALPAYQLILGKLRQAPNASQKPCTVKPCLVESFSLPSSNVVDLRLVAGAVLFGAGWGLSGMCPGPAIVAFVGSVGLRLRALLAGGVVSLQQPCLCATTGMYVISMLLGMLLESRLSSTPTAPSKVK